MTFQNFVLTVNIIWKRLECRAHLYTRDSGVTVTALPYKFFDVKHLYTRNSVGLSQQHSPIKAHDFLITAPSCAQPRASQQALLVNDFETK